MASFGAAFDSPSASLGFFAADASLVATPFASFVSLRSWRTFLARRRAASSAMWSMKPHDRKTCWMLALLGVPPKFRQLTCEPPCRMRGPAPLRTKLEARSASSQRIKTKGLHHVTSRQLPSLSKNLHSKRKGPSSNIRDCEDY